MKSASVTPLRIPLAAGGSVSAVMRNAEQPTACFVFAHGAGAGMDHHFMGDLAIALADRNVSTLRFQFPFMEHGSKRPDAPQIAQAAVRAAVELAGSRLPGVPLFAGGKSFGGRMTSQAQADAPLPGVRGLAFVGFPLHPAGKPGVARADHLQKISVPMLFLQGTRDALADLQLVKTTVVKLGDPAHLHIVEGADHAFHVLVKSGRKDPEVLQELADQMVTWMTGHIAT